MGNRIVTLIVLAGLDGLLMAFLLACLQDFCPPCLRILWCFQKSVVLLLRKVRSRLVSIKSRSF
jgi:hypothetical protein